LSEPLYIALQMAGYQRDAHELVNRTLVPEAKRTSLSLIRILERAAVNDSSLRETVDKIPQAVKELLQDPKAYIGKAAEKAREIASSAKKQINS